jgi:hypothetical protein
MATCEILRDLEQCYACIRAMNDYITSLERDKARLEAELGREPAALTRQPRGEN